MCVKGSSRAPNFDDVRRTPLPTARTRPCSRVSTVTIRSASPTFWVRRATPSSRYRLTVTYSPRPPTPIAHDAGASSRHPSSAVEGAHNRLQRSREDVGVDANPPQDLPVDGALEVGG